MPLSRRTGGLDRDFAMVQKMKQSTVVIADRQFMEHRHVDPPA
jgi:hypothetical protein